MWYNAIIKTLLQSPLHGMLSKSMMLFTWTGRKSGKTYTTPVNYLRFTDEHGEVLVTTSSRGRNWWLNLRGGAQVHVHLEGEEYAANAVVLEESGEIAFWLYRIFEKMPGMARYMDVALDGNKKPQPGQVEAAAQTKVIVLTRLVESPAG